jgi:hypothetical protein
MLRLLPVTTVCATLVGLAEGLRVNFAANITGAAITGAILAVTFALEAGDRATRVRPNAGVRRSLAYALGVSLGFGIPVGLAFAFVINPYVTRPLIEVVEHHGNPSLVIGVAVGLFVFTALFLIYGGFTVLMHGVLRLWLAWRTPLPFDLQRALDRAVELRSCGVWVAATSSSTARCSITSPTRAEPGRHALVDTTHREAHFVSSATRTRSSGGRYGAVPASSFAFVICTGRRAPSSAHDTAGFASTKRSDALVMLRTSSFTKNRSGFTSRTRIVSALFVHRARR